MSITIDMRGVTPWDETTAGTNAGATASHAAIADKIHFVTEVSGHVDEDAVVQVLGGTAGATVKKEYSIDVSAVGFSFSFHCFIAGDPGIKVEAKIANSNADCQVNMEGFTLP